MKKIVLFALSFISAAFLALLSACGGAVEQTPAPTASATATATQQSVEQKFSIVRSELTEGELADSLGVSIYAPQDAAKAVWSIIRDADRAEIAQVQVYRDGAAYTVRCTKANMALADDTALFETTETWSKTKAVELNALQLQLQWNEDGAGLADWYDDANAYAYCIYMESGASEETLLAAAKATMGETTVPTPAEAAFAEAPVLSVDYQNLKATLTWTATQGAEGYAIYRKAGLKGGYRLIAEVDASVNEYADVYFDSLTSEEEKQLLSATNFVDISHNDLVYTVKAYQGTGTEGVDTRTYSDSMEYFCLTEPSLISADVNAPHVRLQWSSVPNAVGYNVYSGCLDESGEYHWQRIADVAQGENTRMELFSEASEELPYYTVEAYSYRNGKKIFSDFDRKFYVNERKYTNTNILFLGDSITFGSPYKSPVKSEMGGTVDFFSYPNRVQQITGAAYYNPSIPGSTYTYSEATNRDRIITQVAQKLVYGGDMEIQTKAQQGAYHQNTKHQRYEDFDIVIFAAGTNDYLDDAPLGNADSLDIDTFNGALNNIMGFLQDANGRRAEMGRPPIKIVFVNLFYSDRTYKYADRTNRFVTENKIGLTLTAYQRAIDQIVKKYRSKGMELWQFDTAQFVTEENCPYRTSDNLHMTRFTYTQIGTTLSEYLIDNGILQAD